MAADNTETPSLSPKRHKTINKPHKNKNAVNGHKNVGKDRRGEQHKISAHSGGRFFEEDDDAWMYERPKITGVKPRTDEPLLDIDWQAEVDAARSKARPGKADGIPVSKFMRFMTKDAVTSASVLTIELSDGTHISKKPPFKSGYEFARYVALMMAKYGMKGRKLVEHKEIASTGVMYDIAVRTGRMSRDGLPGITITRQSVG